MCELWFLLLVSFEIMQLRERFGFAFKEIVELAVMIE